MTATTTGTLTASVKPRYGGIKTMAKKAKAPKAPKASGGGSGGGMSFTSQGSHGTSKPTQNSAARLDKLPK